MPPLMPPLWFSSPATLFALLLLAPSTPALLSRPATAQTSPTSEFDLPESVSSGTLVRIDGSDSMRPLNQVLQRGFQETYGGTEVQTAYSGTDAALEALAAGDIELAAIGRPLTDAEKAQGLVEVPIERHKIALIVAPNNPFSGSITTTQFGQIFRGEIANWSQLGGASQPIQLVDRPETSDTRQAFRGYPVFQDAPFETGDTAAPVAQDSTASVIANLGETGIGYAIADQVFNDPNVRILAMHNTLPDDPRYPFSQPLAYVYQGDRPSPAVQAFLGYATAPQNEAALEAARVEAALAAADGPAGAAGAAAGVATAANGITLPGGEAAEGAGDAGATDNAAEGAIADGAAADGDASEPNATDDALVGSAAAPDDPAAVTEVETEAGPWPWWWLLLLLLLPLLLFLLLRRKGDSASPAEATEAEPITDPAVAPPPPGTAVTPTAAAAAADLTASPAVDPAISPAAGAAPATGTATGTATGAIPGAGAGMAAASAMSADASADGAAALPKGVVVSPVVPLVPLSNDIGSRVVMTSPTPETLRAQWDIADADRPPEADSQLALRLHDITGLAPDSKPHRTWQFPCLERDPALEIEVPDPDATYEGEIGYVTPTDRWLGLARSLPIAPMGAASAVGLAAAGIAAAGIGAGGAGSGAPADSALPLDGPTATQLSLTPQLSNTIHADWRLAPQDGDSLSAQGGPLLLRLYDATGLDLADGTGPLVGQYHCEQGSTSIQVPVAESDRDYVGELGYLGDNDLWVPFARSEKVRLVGPTTDGIVGTVTGVAASPEPEIGGGAAAAAAAAAVAAKLVAAEQPEVQPVAPTAGPDSEVALALEAEGAMARWTLCEADRLKLQGHAPELRIHDVTGIDFSQQAALGTQSYVLSPGVTHQVVTVPVGDRDYLAELGYLDTAQGWTTLARSSHVHIPSGSPAVQAPGLVDTDSEAQTPPPEGIPEMAIAVGLGAVAPSAASLDDQAARYATMVAPGISQIILVPSRDGYAYAYWEVAKDQHEQLQAQGGAQFQLRVHDATGLDIDYQPPHNTQTFDCQPRDCDRHVPIPAGDRDYIAEVGYTTDDGGWLRIIRSFHTWIPQ